MSSNECLDCNELKGIISEQKNKMGLIEKRMKDLIMAYKTITTERDNLLAISSSAVLPLNDSHEQQKRLSILESSVAEMSAICGKYESQRVKDKQLIEQLTQKCEQLTIDLEISHSLNVNNMTSIDTIGEELKQNVRHRGIQTEDLLESNETQKESENELRTEVKQSCDVSTQTDLVIDFDNLNNKSKKSELAIVVPTQRDSIESDHLSNPSPGYSESPIDSNLDTYPVFASNAREVHNNSETLFANSNTHGVSLFYANELARKEIDLAETRLQAREYECALRELQWKYNTDKYKYETLRSPYLTYLLTFYIFYSDFSRVSMTWRDITSRCLPITR